MIVKDEEFPVGMRVLAVDDDSTCLMVLTTLLRKCQYHVTPVNEAIKALELLRNNKDKFDLVITDVDMPEMDGFTLLEYVGREMDLPVIMLSSYSDTELVMKGITHGACDYLLKPIRIEELKNIWQHVVRKKNLDRKERKPSNDPSNEEVKATEDVNKCIKPNKRRKEQNNVVENPEKEDLSTQKKSRLVWTPDLHRKFVAAVNKLGVNKAVPKKILDLMKDKRCTRENIASHLQKYRLYLKNYSGVANRQATKVRPFASVDSARAASIQNVSRSYPNASGFNIPFGLCGPSSSGTIQWNQIDNSRSSFNHDLHMFDEMPMPLDYSTMNLDSLANTVTSVFSELNVNGERNCGFANSMLMLEEEHDLNAPMVPNFEDNWHEQDTTTSDLGGNMLNSATQVIIKPNRDVSFLSSTFNALADVKTLNIIFQEFSPQQSQAFCPGDTSSLVNSPTIHHLSCEGHEFHVNDELLNSGENDQ